MSRLIGGILLIIGTSIGGGMLALPIATVQGGFLGALVWLLACWGLMTFCALLILEVNLWLPPDSNLISMARSTLGSWGAGIAWLTYLLLLYSLLSAYIASGSDVFNHLFSFIRFAYSDQLAAICFTLLFGFIVYQGIHSVDLVNRGLMSIKLLTYIALVAIIMPFIHGRCISTFHPLALLGTSTIIVTSYGFATLIPSLRSYFAQDQQKLRLAIIIGSFIPLICYLCWELAILGTLPLNGKQGLLAMLTSSHSTSDLSLALEHTLQSPWITNLARLFTSICVATSFLGVSIGLSDFLADGLKIAKRGTGKIMIFALTFLPPLGIVLFYPASFLAGLNYAGICCVILLVILPALMAWQGRYLQPRVTTYQVAGGRFSIGVALLAGLLLILLDLKSKF